MTGDDDDDQFLPESELQGGDEDMNISPALRALMAKSVQSIPSPMISCLTNLSGLTKHQERDL